MIDWESEANEVLLNPRFPTAERQEIIGLLQQCPPLKGHCWIATSGSSQVKWTALSKPAIMASAKAVNDLLESTAADTWLNALPAFHVGGLGIQARSYLSGATIIHLKDQWNPQTFHAMLLQNHVTLSALVPAQIYDLINLNLTPPASLRGIVVGGGALPAPLYQKGNELGWKLLPSYGLTEASSQVATADLHHEPKEGVPSLMLLDHMKAAIDPSGRIKLQSPSLLTLYALQTPKSVQFVDPKVDGWFLTEDIGELCGRKLIIKGRAAHFVKIGGESVDLKRLEAILDEIKLSARCTLDMALFAYPDPRLGYVIHLAIVCKKGHEQDIVKTYQEKVLPFEKIRKIHYIPSIPRSPTFKVLYPQLVQTINQFES